MSIENKVLNPLQLLEAERDKFVKALNKSEHSFHVKKEIDEAKHLTHHKNNARLIELYNKAINLLKPHTWE